MGVREGIGEGCVDCGRGGVRWCSDVGREDGGGMRSFHACKLYEKTDALLSLFRLRLFVHGIGGVVG